MAILLLFIILFALTYSIKNKGTIVLIPFYTYLVSVSHFLVSPPGQYSRYSILLNYLFLFFSMFLIYNIIKKELKHNKWQNFGIFIFLFYLFLIIPNSSDIWWSFKRILTASISVLFFLGGFYYFRTFNDIKKLGIFVIGLLLIFELNILFSSINNYGDEYYGGFIRFGSLKLWSSWGFVYSLLLYPLLSQLLDKFYKNVLMILTFIGIILLLIVTKRAFILTIFLGYVIYYSSIRKARIYKTLIPFIILAILTSGFWSKTLTNQFENRKVFQRDYTNEGRYIEYSSYSKVVKSYGSKSFIFFLFGDEPFNSKGKFSIFKYLLNDDERILHSDFSRLLYTTGIIGLLLFILVYVKIYKQYKIYLKNSKPNNRLFILRGTFLAIFITMIVTGFSGSLFLAIPGLIPFLYLGAILGVIKNQYLIERNDYGKTNNNK